MVPLFTTAKVNSGDILEIVAKKGEEARMVENDLISNADQSEAQQPVGCALVDSGMKRMNMVMDGGGGGGGGGRRR